MFIFLYGYTHTNTHSYLSALKCFFQRVFEKQIWKIGSKKSPLKKSAPAAFSAMWAFSRINKIKVFAGGEEGLVRPVMFESQVCRLTSDSAARLRCPFGPQPRLPLIPEGPRVGEWRQLPRSSSSSVSFPQLSILFLDGSLTPRKADRINELQWLSLSKYCPLLTPFMSSRLLIPCLPSESNLSKLRLLAVGFRVF